MYNALNQTYGYKKVDCSGPVINSQEVINRGILLKFKNAERGLYLFGGLNGFEIAGEDNLFYPATAKIVIDRDVYAKSNSVANPVAVRYGWRNWIVEILYNAVLLPESSFRTDNWSEATLVPK